MHAREEVRVDDIVGAALDDHLLVGLDGIGFLRRDEGRADIGEIRAGCFRRENTVAAADGARECDRAVEPRAHLVHKRERIDLARMTAGARGDEDEPVGALLDGLLREGVVDHVVEHDAAIGMHGLVDLLARAERRDHDRCLVLHAHLDVVLESLVRAVDDLVDRVGGRRAVRMFGIPFPELVRDALQPFVEQLGRTRIERRKRADDTSLALGNDEVGIRDDEEWRADGGDAQALLQEIRERHAGR